MGVCAERVEKEIRRCVIRGEEYMRGTKQVCVGEVSVWGGEWVKERVKKSVKKSI